MDTQKKTARLAGLLYLLVIIFGSFAQLYVRNSLIIPGDMVTTAQNIAQANSLFRIGFISDLLMITAFFFLPLVLHRLLHGIDRGQANLMVLSALMSSGIMALNMLNHFAIIIVTDAPYLVQGFSAEQIQGLIALFMDLHQHGYRIAQIFFGLWLFPLGYLVVKSKMIPKIIGVFLMISSASFLIDFLFYFLIPNYSPDLSALITFPTVIGEFSICLWLLIKGVREQAPRMQYHTSQIFI